MNIEVEDEKITIDENLVYQSSVLKDMFNEYNDANVIPSIKITTFSKEVVKEAILYIKKEVLEDSLKYLYSVANFLDFFNFEEHLLKICKFIKNKNDHESTWPKIMNLIEMYPEKNWDYGNLALEKYISVSFMLKNEKFRDRKYGDPEVVYCREKTLSDIEKEFEHNIIRKNEFIELFYSINDYYMTSLENLEKMFKRYPNNKYYMKKISEMQFLSVEFIEQHISWKWDYCQLSYNTCITEDFIKKYSKKNFYINGLAVNSSISMLFFKNFCHKFCKSSMETETYNNIIIIQEKMIKVRDKVFNTIGKDNYEKLSDIINLKKMYGEDYKYGRVQYDLPKLCGQKKRYNLSDFYDHNKQDIYDLIMNEHIDWNNDQDFLDLEIIQKHYFNIDFVFKYPHLNWNYNHMLDNKNFNKEVKEYSKNYYRSLGLNDNIINILQNEVSLIL